MTSINSVSAPDYRAANGVGTDQVRPRVGHVLGPEQRRVAVREEEGGDASLGRCEVWELVQCSLPFCARCKDSKLIAGHCGRLRAAK